MGNKDTNGKFGSSIHLYNQPNETESSLCVVYTEKYSEYSKSSDNLHERI